MEFKDIQELIKLLNGSNISEFKYDDGDVKFSIRTNEYTDGKAPQMMAAPQMVMQSAPPPVTAAAPPAPALSAPPAKEAVPAAPAANQLTIKSPMVGTFYRSAGPGKPTFVKVGDTVGKGTVVCIIEAMKLFNEIESEVAGTIVKVLVEDGTAVEYDQALFIVETA